MSTSFDWSQFKEVKPAPKEESPEFDWSQFKEVKEEKPESFTEKIERHILRSASRIGETALGLPGDIASLPSTLLQKGAEKITGKDQSTAANVAKAVFPGANLPTSSQLKEKAVEASEGYLAPKGKGEEISDEVIQDFTSLLSPAKAGGSLLKTLSRKLGIAAGATGAKELAAGFGAGEKGQAGTKVGTMFLLSIFDPKGASKYVSNLYQDAKELVPEGAKVSAKNLSLELSSLRKQLEKGGSAASKTKAIQKIDEINSKISKKQIPVEELTEFKKTINESRASLYDEFKSDKAGRALAKRNLDSVSKTVDNALGDYAKVNPEWGNVYNDANAGYAAIQSSKKAAKSVAEFLRQNPHLKYGALAAELFLAPKSIAFLPLAYAGIKGVELLARISKSSVLRKYYIGAAEAAVKEDAAAFARNMEKLDSELNKK